MHRALIEQICFPILPPRKYFHYPENRNFDLIFKNYDSSSDIHVFEFFSESVKHYHYNYNTINSSIDFISFSLIDSLLYPIVSKDSMGFTWKNYFQCPTG